MFSETVIQNIINTAIFVLAGRMDSYLKALNLGIKNPNDKSDCGCLCGIKSLYLYIWMAQYRQSEMTNVPAYQQIIYNLFNCISMLPDYYTYMGGGNVINAIPTGGGTTSGGYVTNDMYITPASGSTVIPTSASLQALLAGSTFVSVDREGIDMQSENNTRPDYFSFNSTLGQITIISAASGTEIFHIVYQKPVS